MKVTQLCPTPCDPIEYTVHGILQARILEWVAFPFSRGSSQPRDQTQVSRTAGGFLTSWAAREPKNTGAGSLSLLQWIFPTQESNQGLLHCRQILYQLSYQGSTFNSLLVVLFANIPRDKGSLGKSRFKWLRNWCYFQWENWQSHIVKGSDTGWELLWPSVQSAKVAFLCPLV